jgi:hypothetical protein
MTEFTVYIPLNGREPQEAVDDFQERSNQIVISSEVEGVYLKLLVKNKGGDDL